MEVTPGVPEGTGTRGAAGPPRRKPRLRYLVAGGICLAAIAYLVFGLSENVVYFRTVSEANAQKAADGDDARFRLMGEVVAGSQIRTTQGVAFKVTDGNEVASVFHQGDPPELFGDGVPVVCEGRWQGDEFASDRIMIRHGSEYKPPDVETPPGS
ncbi:MAG: cytochrome c maturation protein CcmE [Acidimicrobiia bacterium]